MLMAVAITTNSEAVFVWICYLSARWLGEGLFCSLHCVSLLLLSSAVTQKSGGWIINSQAMFNATMLLSHPLSSDSPQGWFVFNNIDGQFFVENITYSQLLSCETLLFFLYVAAIFFSYSSSCSVLLSCHTRHISFLRFLTHTGRCAPPGLWEFSQILRYACYCCLSTIYFQREQCQGC